MKRLLQSILVGCWTLAATGAVLAADNPFLGEWALSIPGGGAGWLGVRQAEDRLSASLMWGSGSVVPLASAKLEGDRLVLTRLHEIERKDAAGKKTKVTLTETIVATVQGNTLTGSSTMPRPEGQGDQKAELTGIRQPPVPPAPNLRKVKFGRPVRLFNGKDLAGWRLTDPHALNGWSVKDRLLVNNPVQDEGKPHRTYGNLRTDQEFEDFTLEVEVKVEKGQNSGIYLRGIYEVQVSETYGRRPDSHNMGAVYSRLTPVESAEKPAGEWQKLHITLLDRHVTVVLNGKCILSNQPLLGCTGGALWSDVTRPGPIYLQGDHTAVEYRSMVLRPVVR